MNGTKAAIASTGVWGALIAMAMPILNQVAVGMGDSVDPKIQAAGVIIGGLLSIYGRVTATAKVTGVLKP
jgi:hypothetical protein